MICRLQDISNAEVKRLERTLSGYFPNPVSNRNSIISYTMPQFLSPTELHNTSPHLKGMQSVLMHSTSNASELAPMQKLNRDILFYMLPLKGSDGIIPNTSESYYVILQQLRNQVSSP